MIEVLFYIPSLGAGGAERQCAYFAAALQRDYGFSCKILVTRKSLASKVNLERVEKEGVEVLQFRWFNPLDFMRLYAYFFKHRKATLFCFQTFPNFFGCILARFAGLKNCYGGVRVQDLPPRFMVMEYVVHFLFSRKTIFNSFKGRDCFVKLHFNPRKCLVISNAIEPPRVRKDYAKPVSSRVRLITVGRFKASKDYGTMVRVVKLLVNRGIDFEAAFVGYGQLEQDIRRWVREANVEKYITLLPGENGTDVQQELANSDIYLSTSASEGTSNSIMEAMNAGLPVVATDVGDNDYLIQDGVSGFLRPVKDAVALADAVVTLASNPEMRQKFGIAARYRIEKNHAVHAIVDQYDAIINCGLRPQPKVKMV